MCRPSQNWPGLADHSPGSEKYLQIQRVLSSPNFDHLMKHAVDLRRNLQPDLPRNTTCTVDRSRFASGFNNVALELAFSDNVYWIARIPYRTLDEEDEIALLSEIATMKLIRKRTSIPVPEVFGLDDVVSFGILTEYHPKVARQFARVLAELQTLTFDRIGRVWCGDTADQQPKIIPMYWHKTPGPLDTSFEFFYNQIHGVNREAVLKDPENPDLLTACWVMKLAYPQAIIEDRVRGPFPLCHLDLHYGNLLFDDEYNLTGILDWSSAQAAPLEQLSVSLELTTFYALSEEENRPVVVFRNLVIQSLKEMEDEMMIHPATTLSHFLSSKGAEIMNLEYMSSPSKTLPTGKLMAKILYGESISWEQLREVYGKMPL